MNDSDKPPTFRASWLFWVGLGALCIGSRPLLVVVLLVNLGRTADPNPNPVGLGIIAMISFWPSILSMLGGLVLSVTRYRKQLKQPNGARAD